MALSMDSLRRRARGLGEFGLYLWERFIRDNCLENAATLAYTSLLSIVPLMTVTFAVMAAFPVFEPVNEQFRHFIFANLLPASSEVVQDYVERFAGKAAGLTAAGITGLLVTSLLMMSTADRALNQIWQVPQRRRAVHGFMIYWTVLTLGPLLLGASIGATSYLESMSALHSLGLSLPRQTLLGLLPFLAEFAGFLFMYAAVPNVRVPFRHAVLGALMAALLFELAKMGFAWYVTSFPVYQTIYGALAALPVFLVWLYVSWTVLLLGAEFTHALSAFHSGRAGPLANPRLRFLLAVRLIGHLWQAQRHGRTITRRGLAMREPTAGDDAILQCLESMERAKVVLRTEKGAWALARDPEHYTLLDLYHSQAFVFPDPDPHYGERDEWDRRLAEVLRTANGDLRQTLERPLGELFGESRPAVGKRLEE